MKHCFRTLTLLALCAVLCLPAAVLAELADETAVSSLPAEPLDITPGMQLKKAINGNPISAEIFCADPTSIEYQGRLYVYGTNDHQQYMEKGPDAENTYERIKSFVIFSTADMVNWTYHGTINTAAVAPWIIASWAPSVVSRVEEDGLTHFYLYFSDSGYGVGVLTATDPMGPWTDPLGRPLITPDTPGLHDCPQPFDPGVCLDENGVGWLSFGGGVAPGGTDEMPGTARIVQLGNDLLSVGSEFAEIPAPYFFEASELNVIGGTFVYTYCTNWKQRTAWNHETPVPSTACMAYMTTDTPLDPGSWVFRGECFKNPGQSGFEYSNNHTHMQLFNGRWYMLYHTLALKSLMGIKGGYRSLCVNPVKVDEDTASITPAGGTQAGVTASVSRMDALQTQDAAAHFNAAGIRPGAEGRLFTQEPGAWIGVRQVAFPEAETALDFLMRAQGKGTVEVRIDALNGPVLARTAFNSRNAFSVIRSECLAPISGVHDLYFVFSDAYMLVNSWQFVK